jgi:tetratricopeptide (TPR) repeat protein
MRDWRLHYCLGQAFALEQKWDDAIGHYNKALTFAAVAKPYVLRGRAKCLVHQKRWPQAAADYEAVYEAGHFRAEDDGWRSLALLRLQRGDTRGFQSLCREWLEGLKDNATDSSRLLLAWTLSLAPLADRDRKAAVECAQRGSKIVLPNQGFAHAIRGAILYRDGQFDAALASLEEGVKLYGEFRTPYEVFFLALTHHRLGHAEEAEKFLRQGIDLLKTTPPNTWELTIAWPQLRREAEQVIKGKPDSEK